MLQTKKNNYKKSLLLFRAITHDLRLRMLDHLISVDKGITVTELHNHLGIEQSVTSQHLAILRKAGLVTTVKQGKMIAYSIDKPMLEAVNRISEIIADGKLAETFSDVPDSIM